MLLSDDIRFEDLHQVLARSIDQSPKILQILGLGSCIGVCFYCQEKNLGAMAHVMLPSSLQTLTPKLKGKYADTAIENLVRPFRKKYSSV